jgi:predicted nucleic acid-binding protein
VIYFDTSYLVRLYYQDPGADAVRVLAATDHVASATHGQAEMVAAFHRKLREGVIRPAAYNALLAQLRAHIDGVNPSAETVWNWHTCSLMVFPSQTSSSLSG